MALHPLYESHIRRIGVTFELTGPELDPVAVSLALGIASDDSARRGDERRNAAGNLLAPHDEGWWALRTEGRSDSKDLNDHFRHLLELLVPHEAVIHHLAAGGEVLFSVLWQSTYLYAGTGPILDRDVVAGVAALGGDIALDIYQIDEPDQDEEV